MYYFVELVKELFGFTKYEFIITTISFLLLMSNFCGGLLYNVIRAHGRPQKERPLKDRISFRLFLLSWFFILLFAVYYHTVLISNVTIAHMAFWGVTLVLAPALASFGAQISYVIFQKKIEANKKAYKDWVAKKRAAKAAQMRDATQKEADDKAAVVKKKEQNAEIDAKIAHSRKTHKIG